MIKRSLVEDRPWIKLLLWLIIITVIAIVYAEFIRPIFFPKVEPKNVLASVYAELFSRNDISEICVENRSNWTWPWAELWINSKYVGVIENFEPGAKHCSVPSLFVTKHFNVPFPRHTGELQEFMIIVRVKTPITHVGVGPVIGIWKGICNKVLPTAHLDRLVCLQLPNEP